MFRCSWLPLLLVSQSLIACGDSTPPIDGGLDTAVDGGACTGRCEEPACATTPECAALENTADLCRDGIDNDGDGFADCRDFDCNMNPALTVCGPEEDEVRCADGIDNDNNDFADCEDTGCQGFDLCREDTPEACDDGIDNDADGATDCDDLECGALSLCEGTRVRLIAANLTSNGQTYDGGHGIRILDGLDGDVIMVQEMLFGNNSDAAIQEFVRQTCGDTCEYYRGTGDLLPNGVITRYPIVEGGVWDDPETDTREFAWARIDIPGRADLWAVSVHLLTSSGAARESQARSLAEFAQRDIPDGDLLVIGGDFNTAGGPTFARLAAIVVTDSLPSDQDGNTNTNAPRTRRLDALLVDSELEGREVPVRIGDQDFEGGLVVDTRVFVPIADLAPAEAGDSGAADMQHMAIVRDFVVRGN